MHQECSVNANYYLMISFKKMGIWTELKFLFLPIFSFLPLFSNESETLEPCHPISSFLAIFGRKLLLPPALVEIEALTMLHMCL